MLRVAGPPELPTGVDRVVDQPACEVGHLLRSRPAPRRAVLSLVTSGAVGEPSSHLLLFLLGQY